MHKNSDICGMINPPLLSPSDIQKSTNKIFDQHINAYWYAIKDKVDLTKIPHPYIFCWRIKPFI